MRLSSAALVVLFWLGLPAYAGAVDEAIAIFINEDGFERRDPEDVDARLADLFGQTGAIRSDGAASPVEKALLLVDAMEPPLPRVRYTLRYGYMIRDGLPVSFVSVDRYNLGPVIRQATVEAYGEENVADPEEFGIGPHVEWRIVTMPVIGQTAALLEVARRELRDREALQVDCGGRNCLSPDTLDDVQDWNAVDKDVTLASAYPAVSGTGVSVPARAVAELMVAAGLAKADGGEPVWTGAGMPDAGVGFLDFFLWVQIDRDLGKETVIDAALVPPFMDDGLAERPWLRRVELPGAVHWMQAVNESR